MHLSHAIARCVAPVLALCIALPAAAKPADALPAQKQQEASPANAKAAPEAKPIETVELTAGRKELLQRIDELQRKIPKELERKLLIISMKLQTGWCSPIYAKEFEDEVNKLSPGERRRFEKEWKLVRENPEWPTVASGEEPATPAAAKPAAKPAR